MNFGCCTSVQNISRNLHLDDYSRVSTVSPDHEIRAVNEARFLKELKSSYFAGVTQQECLVLSLDVFVINLFQP